ncbi:MAG: DUF434 domain-containing protein [Phycisphaerae bacterium]
MPDLRKHRGPHPEDRRLFARRFCGVLRQATAELSWLLSRGYAEKSALALVGDRHRLVSRQRQAVRRSSCSDVALCSRRSRAVGAAACSDGRVAIDGYNLLITIESLMADGVGLIGRDGCLRDLASLHGTYRRVAETMPAVSLIAAHLEAKGIRSVDWYLDRPVSNSGRLKRLMAEVAAGSRLSWQIGLVNDPDRVLVAYDGVVATADSWILDRCGAWVNLAAEIAAERVPGAWVVDLREDGVGA